MWIFVPKNAERSFASYSPNLACFGEFLQTDFEAVSNIHKERRERDFQHCSEECLGQIFQVIFEPLWSTDWIEFHKPILTMQYLNDIVDLMVTEEVENFDNSYIVTRVELEVVGCNGDAQLNRKYLVSSSCVCDDDHGGGRRRSL